MKIAITEVESPYITIPEMDRYLVEIAEAVQGLYPRARVIVTSVPGPRVGGGRILVTNAGGESQEDIVRQEISDAIQVVWLNGSFISAETSVAS